MDVVLVLLVVGGKETATSHWQLSFKQAQEDCWWNNLLEPDVTNNGATNWDRDASTLSSWQWWPPIEYGTECIRLSNNEIRSLRLYWSYVYIQKKFTMLMVYTIPQYWDLPQIASLSKLMSPHIRENTYPSSRFCICCHLQTFWKMVISLYSMECGTILIENISLMTILIFLGEL